MKLKPETVEVLFRTVRDSTLNWDKERAGIYRSCFMAASLLLRGAHHSADGTLRALDEWPDVSALQSVLAAPNPSDTLADSLRLMPSVIKLFFLTTAQQRIASALDRSINLALTEGKFLYDDPTIASESKFLWYPPGIRLWLLTGFRNGPAREQIIACYKAFNKYESPDAAHKALDEFHDQLAALSDKNNEDLDSLLSSLRTSASRFTDYECLSFVIARVNAHKHNVTGTSKNKGRPFGIEWCLTANALLGLDRLVRILLFS